MLDELESLLISVALGEVPNRQTATAYSALRVVLLQTYDADVVPGFVSQCISIYKYREFINLYDGRPAERRRFVNDVFDRLYAIVPARGGNDARAMEEAEPEYVSRVF